MCSCMRERKKRSALHARTEHRGVSRDPWSFLIILSLRVTHPVKLGLVYVRTCMHAGILPDIIRMCVHFLIGYCLCDCCVMLYRGNSCFVLLFVISYIDQLTACDRLDNYELQILNNYN